MFTRLLCLLLFVFSLPALAARFYYTGILGARAVQLDLTFEKRGVDEEQDIKKGEVYGHFQYDDGELHRLYGTLHDGRLILHEHPEYDKDTTALSTFSGRLSADRKSSTGSWQGAAATPPLSYTLTAVAEYRAVRYPRRRQLDLTGVYPLFYQPTPGLRTLQQRCQQQLDRALKKFARENRDGHSAGYPNDFFEDYSLEIAYYSPQLLSVRVNDNTFTGGAHGYEDTHGVNYRITADGAQQFGLYDIFKHSTRYMDAVIDLVEAVLERQSNMPAGKNDYFRTYNLTPEIMNVHTVSKAGISFFFPPYVISGYSDGTFSATVSLAAFQDYLAHNDVTALLQTRDLAPPPPERDNLTGISASEAMAMGSSAFLQRYRAQAVKTSWGAGRSSDEDGAADVYAIMAHNVYAWKAAALPSTQRECYLQAVHLLQQLAFARIGLHEAMLSETYAVDAQFLHQPAQADTIMAIVTALSSPLANPTARARAVASLAHAEMLAKGLLTPPKPPVDDQKFADDSHSLLNGLADFKLAIQRWPDTTAALACGYVEQLMAPVKEIQRTQATTIPPRGATAVKKHVSRWHTIIKHHWRLFRLLFVCALLLVLAGPVICLAKRYMRDKRRELPS